MKHLCSIKRLTLVGLSTVVLVSCKDPAQQDFEKGQSLLEKNNPREAITFFERAMARDPSSEVAIRAAQEAARISTVELKNFQKAIDFHRSIVLSSRSIDERMVSQKRIIEIYMDSMSEYSRAIAEIQKLLPQLKDPKELLKYKMDLAKAYFYLNNFHQAENEILEFLKQNIDPRQEFQMSILLANVLMAQKRYNEAISRIRKLMQDHPDQAREENLGLTMAVIYEELQDYKSAIGILEEVKANHPNPEYIEIRIKRLQARSVNQPGARGFRK